MVPSRTRRTPRGIQTPWWNRHSFVEDQRQGNPRLQTENDTRVFELKLTSLSVTSYSWRSPGHLRALRQNNKAEHNGRAEFQRPNN